MTETNSTQNGVPNGGKSSNVKSLSALQAETISNNEGSEQRENVSSDDVELPSEFGQIHHTSRPSDGRRISKSKNKTEISSFEDFITYAYKLKGRKVTLKEKSQNLIAKDLRLSEEAKQRISVLVQKDAILRVPRQLLLAARDVTRHPLLKSAIFTFVRNILLEHPLFLQQNVNAAFRNHEDAPSPIEVLKQISSSGKSVFKDATGPPMKDAEFDRLRCNAVNCMAVWLSEAKGLTISAITDMLYLSLWDRQSRLVKQDSTKLRALTEIEDPASVGLACEQYRSQAKERELAAYAAKEIATTLSKQIQELESKLNLSHKTMIQNEKDRHIEKESFENKIVYLRNSAETEGAHLRADLEELRTRVLRRLKADLLLLEDGLQALRRTEPKVHIMIDVAERVTDALRKESKNLEGGE